MKVTRNKTFSPITIVLETKEEAEMLWHLTNCGLGMTLSAYMKECDEPVKFRSLKDDLWHDINEEFTP